MQKVVNECCDCAAGGYPCRGSSCPLRAVTRYYCDKCKSEDVLYEYDGQELCKDCLLEQFPIVDGSEW